MLKVALEGNEGCPWVADWAEPGAKGWVLTRYGYRVLRDLELDRPLPLPQEGDERPRYEHDGRARPHHRLVVDLAVSAEKLGPVVTEYEPLISVRDVNRPDGVAVSDREDAGRHRPDLLLETDGARWAVEVERTAKGRNSAGASRYSRISQIVAGAGVTLAKKSILVTGIWYLAQSNDRDTSVVRELMRGLFEAVDDFGDDIMLVIQPCDLNQLSTRSYRERAAVMTQLIEEARPLLTALPPVDDLWENFGQGYLTPTLFEQAPRRLSSISVAVAGRLLTTGTRASVSCGGRTYTVTGLPGDLAHPIEPGDRLIVVGKVSDHGIIRAERGRGAGGEWGAPFADDDDGYTL